METTLGLSRVQIQLQLKTHQKRLQMGDKLPSLTEIAERAGLHRDTLYQAINGERISQISQIRLERILKQIASEPQPPSRLMHVNINKGYPVLGFGVGPLLKQSKRP